MIRFLAVASLVWALPVAAQTDTAPQAVPGMRVAMTPPPGFSLSDQFPGFQNDAAESLIVFRDLPGSDIGIIAVEFTPDMLLSLGATVGETQQLTVGGSPAVYATGTYQRGDRPAVAYWTLMMGDADGAAQIQAYAPLGLPPTFGQAMERALRSTTWAERVAPDPFAGLPYALTLPPELSAVGGEDELRVFSDGSGDIAATPVLLAQLGWIQPGDGLDAILRRELANVRLITDLDDIETREIKVGGRLAAEATATGVLDTGEGRHQIMMVIVFGAASRGRSIVFQGFAPYDESGDTLAMFREVVATAQLRWAD